MSKTIGEAIANLKFRTRTAKDAAVRAVAADAERDVLISGGFFKTEWTFSGKRTDRVCAVVSIAAGALQKPVQKLDIHDVERVIKEKVLDTALETEDPDYTFGAAFDEVVRNVIAPGVERPSQKQLLDAALWLISRIPTAVEDRV